MSAKDKALGELLSALTSAEKEARDANRSAMAAAASAQSAANKLTNIRTKLSRLLEEDVETDMREAEAAMRAADAEDRRSNTHVRGHHSSRATEVLDVEFEDAQPAKQESAPKVHQVIFTKQREPQVVETEESSRDASAAFTPPHTSLKNRCPMCRRVWQSPNPWDGPMYETFHCNCGYKVMAGYNMKGT